VAAETMSLFMLIFSLLLMGLVNFLMQQKKYKSC